MHHTRIQFFATVIAASLVRSEASSTQVIPELLVSCGPSGFNGPSYRVQLKPRDQQAGEIALAKYQPSTFVYVSGDLHATGAEQPGQEATSGLVISDGNPDTILHREFVDVGVAA